MYWRYTSLMILLFSVGRIVQLENISFPHPCHLDVWITCCLGLSWAACVLCILNRSWDLLFWEPPSFSTLGKQLMQQWLKIGRHEHLMSCEAFLSAASLGLAHEVKPLWSSSDLCIPVDTQMCGSCSISWLNIPVYRVLLGWTAEGSSSWNIPEHTVKTRALKVSSHRQRLLLTAGLKEKSRGVCHKSLWSSLFQRR